MWPLPMPVALNACWFDLSFTKDRLMAGLTPGSPTPEALTLHEKSRVLEISFSDGQTFRIPFELMRVYSPSAEVRGHGPGQETLQTGKQDVEILQIEPVGTYAVQLHFSDQHNTGLYSWDILYDYGINQDTMWANYLKRLAEAGANR
jgi:DUF971 family protein